MSVEEHQPDDRLVEPLTRREREILGLLDQGLSAPEIAEQLTLAVSSVKWHIQQLYGKLGVNGKRQALTRAGELGLLGGAAASATADAATAAASAAASLASPAEPPETPEPGESPFKGLRHFDETDAALFFGREALAARLVARLVSPASAGAKGPTRFLAVVGASGSGKSSIVRAGVIPALRRADGTASHFAPIHLMTPTARPLEALAVGLNRKGESVTATATLIDDLARDERALHLYARRLLGVQLNALTAAQMNLNAPTAVQIKLNAPMAQAQVSAPTPARTNPAQSRLLLVVDQFEELFTLCHGEPERQAFIDNLRPAARPQPRHHRGRGAGAAGRYRGRLLRPGVQSERWISPGGEHTISAELERRPGSQYPGHRRA